MNATWITLCVVLIALFGKLFSWYIDKPRQIRALKEKERVILEELRWATIHLDTRRMAILERQLRIVRNQLKSYDEI